MHAMRPRVVPKTVTTGLIQPDPDELHCSATEYGGAALFRSTFIAALLILKSGITYLNVRVAVRFSWTICGQALHGFSREIGSIDKRMQRIRQHSLTKNEIIKS